MYKHGRMMAFFPPFFLAFWLSLFFIIYTCIYIYDDILLYSFIHQLYNLKMNYIYRNSFR